MASNWTEDQKKAISSIGGTVLVAAAAGSGRNFGSGAKSYRPHNR